MRKPLAAIVTTPSHLRGLLSAFTQGMRKAKTSAGPHILCNGGLEIGKSRVAKIVLQLREKDIGGIPLIHLNTTKLAYIRHGCWIG